MHDLECPYLPTYQKPSSLTMVVRNNITCITKCIKTYVNWCITIKRIRAGNMRAAAVIHGQDSTVLTNEQLNEHSGTHKLRRNQEQSVFRNPGEIGSCLPWKGVDSFTIDLCIDFQRTQKMNE